MQRLEFFFRVVLPVGRPDSQNLPAEPFEDIFTHQITISGRGGTIVGGTVALDSREEHFREVWMHDPQVNSE